MPNCPFFSAPIEQMPSASRLNRGLEADENSRCLNPLRVSALKIGFLINFASGGYTFGRLATFKTRTSFRNDLWG